ncbi:sensor histidine kinase [Polyangium aurulentum]|uniref:sensor histidine kinase n=1 Tax=Polyangium aurulentum TaxID=2567896 RepID=UPI0010AEA4C2|nr:hybrid sensor histidine kinase/response regulator [Polyangium aurulentum]UQA56434.1 response regulator [Polyangium aurulentum]
MNDSETPTRLRVLLVDDDTVDRMAIVRALGKLDPGIEVRQVASSDAALEELRGGPFDCVISDLHMPGRDGAWLLAAIKREGLDVPFVVLTGQGDEQTAVALMKAGAADYAVKAAISPSGIGNILRHAVRVHRAEREARIVQERLTLALEATALGIWDWYPRADDLRCDARCKALFGLPPDAPLSYAEGRAAIHPEDMLGWQAALTAALDPAGGGRYESEFRIIGIADRQERWVRASGQVFFKDGAPVRVVGTLLDVTARRREEMLARRRLEFEQQLIGIVSHDLRNPIAAMVTGAAILRQALPADSPLKRTAARVASSGERATRLIRDLLDFTQARTGSGIPIARREADIHLVCKHAVDEVAFNNPGREIVHRAEGEGRGAWDPDRISQVVDNLTRNAVSYSPPGSVVTVRSRDDGARVLVEVHNQGTPIPEDVLPTLFEPFKRGERKQDPDRSIGLGLFIVREIVSAHGGEVTVRSTAAEGTTFSLDLPRD